VGTSKAVLAHAHWQRAATGASPRTLQRLAMHGPPLGGDRCAGQSIDAAGAAPRVVLLPEPIYRAPERRPR
jgi:hypothetical protein